MNAYQNKLTSFFYTKPQMICHALFFNLYDFGAQILLIALPLNPTPTRAHSLSLLFTLKRGVSFFISPSLAAVFSAKLRKRGDRQIDRYKRERQSHTTHIYRERNKRRLVGVYSDFVLTYQILICSFQSSFHTRDLSSPQLLPSKRLNL